MKLNRGSLVCLMALACSSTDPSATASTAGTDSTTGSTATSATVSASATLSGSGTTGTSTSGETDGTKFDVGETEGTGSDTEPPRPTCKVVDDMDAIGECDEQAPPDSFEPDIQWTFMGDGSFNQSIVSVLVGNFTDDNGDDEIDLCDVPDVLATVFSSYGLWDGNIYALDGETGAVHWQTNVTLDCATTPAFGDIDGDMLPEILAVQLSSNNLLAFEHDGSLKWTGDVWPGYRYGAIALADLDNDGDVEIVAGNLIFDHQGNIVQTLADQAGTPGFGNASAAADLDDDGDLEVIIGRSAFHHDGTQVFMQAGLDVGYPQVADLDADPEPEVLLETPDGLSMLEHDGTIKFQNLRPTGASPGFSNWMRPSTVHDFDGDSISEFAVSSAALYAVYEADASVVWTAPVNDGSGVAAGTAFDFLGDGIAEAMYADQVNFYIYDGNGQVLLQVPRNSGTIIEYPVVADIDNDGSSEIVVISNNHQGNSPAVQAVRDVQDRWIQARRIWNQHTYHVTNVREDGTIPQFEPANWKLLNTYRTNAQIEGGGLCKPDPEG